MRCGFLLATFFGGFMFAGSAIACGSVGGHINPVAHQPYVADGCVYYGKDGGYIVSGQYAGLIISDELLSGFDLIKGGRPDRAFSEWMTLSALGNRAAQYNLGRMLHVGWGSDPNFSSALDYLFEAMKSESHFNTANAEAIRVLQEALIGLEYLRGNADGVYGEDTDKAVDRAIEDLDDSGSNPESDYWYFWAIAEMFERRRGVASQKPGQPVIQDANPEVGRESMPQYVPEVVVVEPSMVADDSLQSSLELRTSRDQYLDVASLYAKVSPSVHMIFAAKTLDDFQTFADLMQGSAVAVSPETLLTNCHVIDGYPYIVIILNGVPVPAVAAGGDIARDTCFLRVDEVALKPVANMRSSSGVAIGERVITIGSPKGQENSISEGVVSGIREMESLRYLQITAPISPGSSGGGLFDAAGNLIGITTMLLEGGQALNFAISIEEFDK